MNGSAKVNWKQKKGDVLTGIAHLYQRSDYIYEYACDRVCVCVQRFMQLSICISFSMINSISFNCIDKLLVFFLSKQARAFDLRGNTDLKRSHYVRSTFAINCWNLIIEFVTKQQKDKNIFRPKTADDLREFLNKWDIGKKTQQKRNPHMHMYICMYMHISLHKFICAYLRVCVY